MKHLYYFLFAILSLTIFSACGGGSGSESIDWIGTYTFEEIAGPGMDGEAREYYYTIEIEKSENGYGGVYNLDGYQLMARYNCSVAEENGELVLYFESYGEDHEMGNGYDDEAKILTMKKIDDQKFLVNDGTEMEFTKFSN